MMLFSASPNVSSLAGQPTTSVAALPPVLAAHKTVQ
jgi:hypothetical protein